jgi:two-component system, cell cycle sensor histidine kinase and response regulator CckA
MNKHFEILKIVFIYAVIGGAWIYFSDTMLAHLGQQPESIIKIAIIKGFAFVTVTSMLLYLLIARLSGKIDRSNQALGESEQRLHLLVKNSSDNLVIIDADGVQKYVSPAANRITGFSAEELQDKNINHLIHADDLPAVLAAWNEAVAHPEKTVTVQYRHIHATREWVYLEAVAQSFLGEAAINGVIASVRDISERMQHEEALRTTNETLSQFIRHSPIYAFIKEVTPTESRTLYASENYRDMIGIPGSEMVGKTMEELFPADFAAQITADDWRVISNDTILQLDEELHNRHYTTIKFPIVLGNKHLLAGYTIDITARKQSEMALQRSRMLLEMTEKLSNVGGWEWDVGKQQMTWTAGTYRLHGFTPDDFPPGSPEHIQRSIDCYAPEDQERIRAAFARCVSEGHPYDIECGFSTADGRLRHIRTMGQAMRDENGDIFHIIGTFHDITERKREEEEKEKLQAQLLQAQKLESVGRLAGGVAHDFNNMLSVILGYAGLALEQTTPEQPTYVALQEIRHAAQRSADLTRQLLAFARKQTVTPVVLDLNETVASMLNMLRRLIGEHIDLNWLPGKNLGHIKMDPSQLDQILANLCVNARDAIGETGTITIATGHFHADAASAAELGDCLPGEYVVLTVRDTGSGMDSEMLEHLFEPFFTTKEVGEGTGLGLATVYGIVKQNNGCISAESEPGQGSTFAIYIPRYLTGISEVQTPEIEQPVASGHETVLLVEDEPMILKMVTEMLQHLGYNVLPAATPGKAIHLAENYGAAIHLLMTDVVMPEMNGRDLAAKLLTLQPRIKQLFMSGYTADVIAQHGVVDEGIHFIQKPFAVKDLAAKIQHILKE